MYRSIVHATILCALIIVFAGGILPFAQQPPTAPPKPTFRAATDVVRLEVTVLDQERRPVRGLTKDDFVVSEEGQERPIIAFTHVELPTTDTTEATAPWIREAPRDIVSNIDRTEGRLVIIVFDWSIRFYDQATARRIAEYAIESLGPGDQAALVFTGGASTSGTPINFTADRSLLRAAINRPFAVAMTDPSSMAFSNPDMPWGLGCHCGTCTMDTIQRVASNLRSVSQHPKVILFIGTYVKTFESAMGPRPQVPLPGQIQPGLALHASTCQIPLEDSRKLFERAVGEANATVHVIDPVGLETGLSSPMPSRIQERQSTLPVMADMTGGRAVLSTNAPEQLVGAIVNESSSYYLLAFEPAAKTRDTEWRRISVRAKRPNVTVKARNGYAPLEQRASTLESEDPDLIRTLGGVLPATEVPFEASIVPMIANNAGTVVVVGRLGPVQSRPLSPVTVLSAAFTPRGKAVASSRISLRSERENSVEGSALGLVSGLVVEPGIYDFRVAAELTPGVAGSVNAILDMPDFRQSRLSMSGVLVHVSPEEPSEPRGEIQGSLPFVPTARRAFGQTDAVSTFVQIGQGIARRDELQAVNVRARIIDARGGVIHDQMTQITPSAFRATRSTNVRLSLPLRALSGLYLLELEATMGEHSTERSLRFEVR